MYHEPVFRPPSEANSLILQATLGCSWNKCAFCEMYSTKRFIVRNEEEVFEEIRAYSEFDPTIRKVFLADGNAMVLSGRRLLNILKELKKAFPKLHRVSAYALPSDIITKSPAELKALYEAGLKLIYVGIESGDDELLKLINKNETYASTAKGLKKAHTAGIQSSVMILTGLGGKKYSEAHAINSARIVNEAQPYFLSTLVLSFPFGERHYIDKFKGDFEAQNIIDYLTELRIFIEHTDLKGTIFRSDHASNYLTLKGILPKDKNKFLERLDFAIQNPESAGLRPEWMRGL